MTRMKRPLPEAIATDVHFWIPVGVLVVGLALLFALMRLM